MIFVAKKFSAKVVAVSTNVKEDVYVINKENVRFVLTRVQLIKSGKVFTFTASKAEKSFRESARRQSC